MFTKHCRIGIFVLASFSFAMGGIFADTIIVPDDQPTIQAGIDSSSHGDTVLVKPGTYVENIDFLDRRIHVKSRNGPWVTVIDGNQNGSVVTMGDGTRGAILEGFTITNGTGTYDGGFIVGGGIYCLNSYSPVIKGNVIIGNAALGESFGHGGGIYCSSNCARICDNLIFKNRAESVHSGRGGGIYVDGWQAVISNNVIYKNSAHTQGGGIYFDIGFRPCFILSNTIYQNSAQEGGAIFFFGMEGICANSILWDNEAETGKELYVFGLSSYLADIAISHCDVQGGMASVYVESGNALDWGAGMIDADPLFVNPAGIDFHLQQDPCQPGVQNPCVDAGSNHVFNEAMDVCWTRTSGEPDEGVVDMGYHSGDYVWPTLRTDGYTISASTGGSVRFYLAAGIPHYYRKYLVLGGSSGYEPGYILPGGLARLPLNWDALTDALLQLINTPVCKDFLGELLFEGYGEAECDIGPLDPGVVGTVLHFAYTLNAPFNFASNPVRVEVIP